MMGLQKQQAAALRKGSRASGRYIKNIPRPTGRHHTGIWAEKDFCPWGGRGCLLGNRLTEEWKVITEENSQLGVQGWGSASWFCLLFTAQVGTVKCPVSNTYSFSRPHLLWGERRKPPNPKHRGTGWGKRYGKGQTGFRKTQPIPLLFS